ncbi:MAG: zinc ribbon domain-containing protein [bacterium]
MENNNTTFKQKSIYYQDASDRTKESGINSALSIIGWSFIIGSVGFIIWIISRTFFSTIGFLVTIGGVIGIIVGLIRTIINIVRKTKRIKCPKCNTEVNVYGSVKKYMCLNCRSLLLLGKDSTLNLKPKKCHYCGHETFVTEDHGNFLCSDCGIILQSNTSSYKNKDEREINNLINCPNCNKQVPKTVIYCKYCNEILINEFELCSVSDQLRYDLDWKIGKSSLGHFNYARAVLKNIRVLILKAENLWAVRNLKWKLETVFISLEEAITDHKLYQEIGNLLPEIDLLYSDILEQELKFVKRFDQKIKYPKDEFSLITYEPQIQIRRKIESIFGSRLEAIGSVGVWGNNLVEIKEFDKKARLESYSNLESEVERFLKWKSKHKETN